MRKTSKFISVLLAVLMICSILPFGAFADGFAKDEGDGKYHVADAADLTAFRDAVNAGKNFSGETVILDSDIDMSGETWTAGIGVGSAKFSGTFDGNGKTISNLTVNAAENYAGLFGSVFTATIKNVTLDNATVSNTGENYTAALVGGGYANIEGCTVKNSSVSGTDQIGGIIGYLSCGSVKNCTVDSTEVTASGDRPGGIAGKANTDSQYVISGNTVSDCTIQGKVSAAIVGQIMTGNGQYEITNNNVKDTKVLDENGADAFNPIGNFRSGSYNADTTKIANNYWTPADPASFKMVNPNDESQYFVVNTYVAKIGEVYYLTLAEAVAAANEGQIVEVIAAGTYRMPNIPKNITVKGAVDDVAIDATGSGSICSVPNGVTFENLAFSFGNASYHGFQHAGTINMNGCTLNGLFFSYGDMNFTECKFVQTTEQYMMWAYGKDLSFKDCTFDGQGKFINVYCESNSETYNITADGCTFTSSVANKSAFNVKATCGSTALKYNVVINNCTTDDNFPTDKRLGEKVVMIDDGNSKDVTITLDDVQIYPEANKEVEVKVGDTETLDTALKTGSNLTWTSDKEDVATVDETGVVTGVAYGEATITAAANDVSGTATFKVKVLCGHTDTEVQNAKDATCTEDGYTGDEVCKICGDTVKRGEAISALGHDTEVKGAKAATETEDGYTGDKVCKTCGATIEKGKTIPATGHTCPFTDIKDSGYHDWIEQAEKVGIINGYPDKTYRPNANVTRAQFITMLYRAVGSPEASGKLSFTDNGSIAAPYMDAVVWGVENNIILGYTDNTFRPDQEISRAQMATFMYRYMKNVAKYDFGKVTETSFADKADIANPYVDAVNAIVSVDIMNGMTKTTFAPNATANRGMAATVMLRMYNLLSD